MYNSHPSPPSLPPQRPTSPNLPPSLPPSLPHSPSLYWHNKFIVLSSLSKALVDWKFIHRPKSRRSFDVDYP